MVFTFVLVCGKINPAFILEAGFFFVMIFRMVKDH